jgi:hypothetical protein
MTQAHVAIIILNWNGCDDTMACLHSLQGLNYPDYEIIVVDNGSTDNSIASIRMAFPQVRLIEAGANLGFVGGNNLGLDQADQTGADYSLLLNNDTEVAPDFLQQLIDVMEADASVGATGPLTYYFADPKVIWSAGGEVDRRRGTTRMTAMGETDHGQFDGLPHPVDFIAGSGFLIKMRLYQQVGGLDPRFFAYYEDTEWCLRITRAGYRILLVPKAKIWHKISPQARESSPRVHYYMTRNRLLFLKCARAGWLPWLATFFDFTRTLVSWTLRPRWRYKGAQRKVMLRAIWDYFRGRLGEAVLP